MRAFAVALLAAASCVPWPGDPDAGPPPGRSWRLVLEEQPGALLSVTGTADDDVWIVGADKRDGSGPTIWHYDGDALRALESGDEGDLWWVAVEPERGDVWMVGEGGRVFRYDVDDEVFDAMRAPDETRLYGVMPFAPDDVWAVGGDEDEGRGVVWRYDGALWTRPAALTDEQAAGLVFFKIWGASADDLWIVGIGGAALHYTNGAFARVALPVARPLFTVHGDGAADVVVGVGGYVSGLVVEVDGGVLVDKSPEGVPELIGVHVKSDGSATAAGYEGALWQRSAAGAWRPVAGAPGTLFSYHAVWNDPTGGIWAVGGFLDAEPLQQGILAHYGGIIPVD